jgi:hypothetical protein
MHFSFGFLLKVTTTTKPTEYKEGNRTKQFCVYERCRNWALWVWVITSNNRSLHDFYKPPNVNKVQVKVKVKVKLSLYRP